MKHAVILSATRTPVGSLGGALADVPAVQLGATAIKSAVERAGITPNDVDEVIMGMVLQGGAGQAPARQAAIGAGIPDSKSAWTINKVCSSGLKAVMEAAGSIQLEENKIVVAGGMENMSQAPYILKNARFGYRYGDGQLNDLMIHDGLWDPYGNHHMGICAEVCSEENKISREEQDAHALESYKRANESIANGLFKAEITPVVIPSKKGDTVVDTDEEPGRGRPDKVPTLKPAFKKDGTVTAANASSINDGAAALVV
ncbi:MAG: acetyl-CoA C-acyltransferase, partial [bacterium]